MPVATKKRESLMSFNSRHLATVEAYATGYLTMDEIEDSCRRRYDNLFGRLRPRGSRSVPSDDLRRSIIIHRFLDLVQQRRWYLERLAKVRGGPTPIWLSN